MAVKKTDDPKSSASSQLLDINSALQANMSDILAGMKTEEGIAVLPAGPVKEAAISGGQALIILKNVNPQAPEIPAITVTSMALANSLKIIQEENGLLTMPADAAKDLVNKIINIMTNQIHDAAVTLAGATGHLGGCNVSKLLPDSADSVSKYCSGVFNSNATVLQAAPKKMAINGKQVFIKYPQQIVQKLGVHHVEVSPAESKDPVVPVGIEYHDSVHYSYSKERWQGVLERLKLEGFACDPKTPGTIIYCHGDIPKPKLRQLAIFFSMLLNADVSGMGDDTTGVVRDWVWDKAGEFDKKYGDQTWNSGLSQVNWKQAQNEWKTEGEFKKNTVVYTDLRKLLQLRDKHHELIEKAYHVEAVAAGNMVIDDPEGIKQVIASDKEALALLKKNKWSHGSFELALSNLENALSSGQKHLMGSVDHVGNSLHLTVAHIISQQGQYGGCITSGVDVSNINAGNLAYCEGVLKGTSTELSQSGNRISHKVAPKTYVTITFDEDPDGGYNTTFLIPEPAEWGQPVAKFLAEHKKFKCSGSQCKTYVKNLDDIRELALFFSNLKGASETIGTECGTKALELAFETAKEYNKKGVFSFTLSPPVETDKAWVKLCHSKYGILPPGMTPEQQQIMTKIGVGKKYGGCSFENTEELPGAGELIYCEGVRKNPQADISAFLDAEGHLHHYFHGTTDEVAEVSIIPMGKNSFQVKLGDLDFKGSALQNEMVKQFKTLGLTCPDNDNCSGEVYEGTLRKLAAFISSVHQIYKVADSCVPAAVGYVKAKVADLPGGLGAHDSEATPWTTEQWNKTVCSKLAPGLTPPKPPVEPAKPSAPAPPSGAPVWKGWGPLPNTPFIFKGCTSQTKQAPTGVKQSYCAGVIGQASSGGETVALKVPGALPGTAAILGTKENKHWVGGPQVIFDSKWNTLFVTLPDDFYKIKPLVGILTNSFNMIELKDTPKTFKRWYGKQHALAIARFLSRCSGISHLPESCWPSAVQWAYDHIKDGGPIYPFLAADWNKEVCEKGKTPPTTPPAAPVVPGGNPLDEMNALVGQVVPGDVTVTQAMIDATKSHIENMPVTQPPNEFEMAEDAIKSLKQWPDDTIVHAVAKILQPYIEKYLAWKAGQSKTEGPPVVKPGIDVGHLTGATAVKIQAFVCDQKGVKVPLNDIIGAVKHLYSLEDTDETDDFIASVYNLCPKPQEEPLTPAQTVKDAATVEAPNKKPDLDALIDAQQEVYNKLDSELAKDKALMKHCVDADQYKHLPQKCKDYVHTLMNLRLLKDHKDATPFDKTLKDLQTVLVPTFPHLTPLQIKKQLELEKKRKIRKGELPGETGQPVAKTYETLPQDEQSDVQDTISSMVEGGNDTKFILNSIIKDYGLVETKALIDQVVHEWETHQQEEVKPENWNAVYSALEAAGAKGLEYSDISQKTGIEKSTELEGTLDAMLESSPPAIVHEGTHYILATLVPIKAGKEIDLTKMGATSLPGDIHNILKQYPGVAYSAEELLAQYKLNFGAGMPVTVPMVHKALEELAEKGEIKWEIVGDKFLYGELAEDKKPAEAPKFSLSDLAGVIDNINKGFPQFGCYPDHPGVELSPIQATYCQGIQTPPGSKKAGFVQVVKGTGDEAVPIVSQFGDGYNAIATSPEPNSLAVAFKEVAEKKGPQWKQRQQVVAELLVNTDFDCSFLNSHFVCKRDGLNMAEEGDRALTRMTALFLSKLHDIDNLPFACVNRAVRFALAQAHEEESLVDGNAWQGKVYPYTVADWEKEVCSKVETKPVKQKAADKAKELGTVGLLELAHKFGIDPTGSDAALAQKIIEAGIIDP